MTKELKSLFKQLLMNYCSTTPDNSNMLNYIELCKRGLVIKDKNIEISGIINAFEDSETIPIEVSTCYPLLTLQEYQAVLRLSCLMFCFLHDLLVDEDYNPVSIWNTRYVD